MILLVGVALVGSVGPFLCDDIPLVARVDGDWSFPAFRATVGAIPRPPADTSWKGWWLSLPEGSADFAVMPPWAYGPGEVHRGEILAAPRFAHPLGMDDVGRDQLTRIVHGTRTALIVAVGVVGIALIFGVIVGGIAGLAGGLIDALLLRFIEFFASFPALVAALAGAAFFGGSILNVIVLLALVQWTQVARIVRGEVLSLRERPFVEAARGLGVSRVRLLLCHVLPQLRGPLFVTGAFLAADAIQVESTLSFLGVGAGPATVSWGAMLDQGRTHAFAGVWHLWLFPAVAIAVTVIGLHALADSVGRTAPRRRSQDRRVQPRGRAEEAVR